MNGAEFTNYGHQRFDQLSAEATDEPSTITYFSSKSVSNKHPSKTSVAAAETDQQAPLKPSLWTRMTHQLSRLSVTGLNHEKSRSRQAQEVAAHTQLREIMTERAFDDLHQEGRSEKISIRYRGADFCTWYNENKSNLDLKKILIEQKDTDVVRALKSQIVQYEERALNELKSSASQRDTIPHCLKLKAEDLFDKDNNYLNPNPALEITEDETNEVLMWYFQGIRENPLCPGEWYVRRSRTLENTDYSNSEVARKLEKYVAVREQRAVDALKKLMPDEAFKVFQIFMEGESTVAMEIKSANPLVDWYNSCADSDPEFLNSWRDRFLKTKAQDAYHAFLVKYSEHAHQKFKKAMGDTVYNSCYTQLPYMLPRDAMAKNNEVVPGYLLRESSSFASEHLARVNTWRKSLSDDQWQQLSEGESRNSYNMNWLKNVLRVDIKPKEAALPAERIHKAWKRYRLENCTYPGSTNPLLSNHRL